MICGGKGNLNPVTEDVTEYCNSVRGEVESQNNAAFQTWEPVSFRSQVVAGTNFFVKVHVGENQYVHLRIFRGLPHTGGNISLSAFTPGMTLESDL